MKYYTINGALACSTQEMPLPPAAPAPGGPAPVFLFSRPGGRDAFCLTHPGMLHAPVEDARWLDSNYLDSQAREGCDPALLAHISGGGIRAVNTACPGWQGRLAPPAPKEKYRLNLLALGDVGSTLLLGLRLLGGDIIGSIGICDIDPAVSARWEVEMEQIAWPLDYDALPPVEAITPDRLFDGDVFVFCASRAVPPVGSGVSDVRMAQYALNGPLVASYARQAAQAGFGGLFAVVSDPVDPLCRSALTAAEGGLLPGQVRGYGLGVMNARAAYFARRDGSLSSFLTQGRAYGPHGAGLVIANSVANYDDDASRRLTDLTVAANLQVRRLGFKPYVAPAVASGAMSLLLTLRGRWHYSSAPLGGVFMGALSRLSPLGPQAEHLALPPALAGRLSGAYAGLAATEVIV